MMPAQGPVKVRETLMGYRLPYKMDFFKRP